MKEGLDWSVFDIQAPFFNPGSGTQIRMHGFGRINNTLVNWTLGRCQSKTPQQLDTVEMSVWILVLSQMWYNNNSKEDDKMNKELRGVFLEDVYYNLHVFR